MSERADARRRAGESGFGAYVATACPGRTKTRFEALLGALFLGTPPVLGLTLAPEKAGQVWVLLLGIVPLLGGATAGLCGYVWLRWRARVGGPLPRLYCFEQGFVLARAGELSTHRWTEVRVDSAKWWTGPMDDRELHSRDVVTGADGVVLAEFHDEYDVRSGIEAVRLLHAGAARTAAGGS